MASDQPVGPQYSGEQAVGPSDGKISTNMGTTTRKGTLALNDLNYVLPPDLSVSVNNTYKNHFFQSSTYTYSQRAICLLNSGADYGDLRTSTLNFEIGVVTAGDATAYFGPNGSILNIIKSITLTSRSGDELSRITDLNHLAAVTTGFRYSKNWMETVGQTLGYGECLFDPTRLATRSFSIPLYLLSDLFAYNRLMPAMLLSGLRIEIDWEEPANAFQIIHSAGTSTPAALTAGVVVSDYTITNPYISMRSVQLTDGTQRALNEMSAVNGLEIVYCDYEKTEQPFTANMINLEVRKAASRALKAYAVTRIGAAKGKTMDTYRTEDFKYTQWQWQLGSLYFPQQPVKNATPSKIIPESYQHTLVTFNTYKGDATRCSAIPLRQKASFLEQNVAYIKDLAYDAAVSSVVNVPNGMDYKNDANFPWTDEKNDRQGLAINHNGNNGTFANGRSTLGCLLERSDLFNLTGVPINNSRVLMFNAQYSDSVARIATVFLKYVRLARVFLNNIEVEQ